MSLVNRYLYVIEHHLRSSIFLQTAKYSTLDVLERSNQFERKYSFTEDQQRKILNTLNECNSSELTRFKVTQARIKNLEKWKVKKGTFKSLSEVLEVEGLGEKLLGQLCENIINNNVEQDSVKSVNNNTKRLKHILIPQMTPNVLNTIESSVGIHLGPTGISWAKILKVENKLCNWNYKLLTSLPNKLSLHETFDLAVTTIQKLPPGDVYIFEGNSTPSQSKSANISSYNQHLELMSMLFALLNASEKHNRSLSTINGQESCMNIENQVYQLKSKVPARLFKTLVGNEKVSALNPVSELVNGPTADSSMPCQPIVVDSNLKQFYNSQPSASKELLGQALMLVISFMDLCIYKNPYSIAALSPGRKNNTG